MERLTVVVQDDLQAIKAVEVSDKEQAKETAERLAKEHNDKQVFIEYFRESDGQRGYINKDGFALTGKSWA